MGSSVGGSTIGAMGISWRRIPFAPVRCLALALALLALTSAAADDAPVPLAGPFTHQGGHAWLAAAPEGWPGDGVDGESSRLLLLEDGAPLGPAHALHDTVREQGGGAYSHWGSGIWFSTSDGSDPNTNGRAYAVRQAAPPRVRRVLPLPDPFVLLPPRAVALGAAGLAGVGAEPPAPGPRAPRVVWWYTIDALRADTARAQLPDGSPLMPALDAFRREAVDFRAAYAQSSFTKTSTASMFTGLWPQRHGVMHGVVPTWPAGGTLVFDLDRRFYTLAEYLADRGYDTRTHLYTVHVRPGDGMLQGFARSDLASERAAPLDALPERLFVYEHILGVHGPYAPSVAARARLGSPPPTQVDPASLDWFYRPLDDAQVAELRAAYRGEAVDSDAQLAARLDWLRATGAWDDALVIVTADHGEEFLEHGSTQHSVQLYDELLHVPLLVKFPAGDPWAARHGQTVDQRVRLVDLFPTLVELLGEGPDDLPYALDGASLGPVLEGREQGAYERDVLARVSFTTEREHPASAAADAAGAAGAAALPDGPTLFVTDAVIAGRLKALLGWRIRGSQDPARRPFAQGDELAELYDIAADPGETSDLSARRGDALDDLATRLLSAFAPLLPPGTECGALLDVEGLDADPALLRTLRELGYLR